MGRLHRGYDAKLFETRNVIFVDDLDMFDTVARIALAVRLRCGLVGVEHHAHRAVADRVDGDGEFQPVCFGDDVVEMLLAEQWIALPAGAMGVVVEENGTFAFGHAIDEHFDKIAAQPVGVETVVPCGGLFFKVRDRHEILHVIGHAHPHRQAGGLLYLVQNFQLIEIAVHVLNRGYAQRGAIGEAVADDIKVDGAFFPRHADRFATGANA
ncbi:hypothetical protein D3C80_739810 [compost metagenome]